MKLLFFLFFLPQFILANTITLPPSQPSDLASLISVPILPPTLNTTNLIGASTSLTNEPVCFPATRKPPLVATTKANCEAALDIWVRDQSLISPRRFSRSASLPGDVRLPLQRERGNCVIYADVLSETDEDVLTLAEVYAELLGPDGVMKQCLKPVSRLSIGGRMILGRAGVLRIVVTGKVYGGVEEREFVW